MNKRFRRPGVFLSICCAVLIFLSAPAWAQSSDKISREVIDQAAAAGRALVLVGLDVPWQIETDLSADEVRTQRANIASIQSELLDNLDGTDFTITRRYKEIPGIALEVGADALAELARLPLVTNVLLDRPSASAVTPKSQSGPEIRTNRSFVVSEKVPAALYERVARDGTVLVLAGLKTPWQLEEGLSDELWALQRTAIHSAQGYLLAELTGTRYKVIRLYGKIPGIALRVGLDALRVLERSPAITNVILDRPAQARP